MDPNEKYLKPKEACELLGIGRRALYTWEKEGKITPVRTKGGHCRYLRSQIFPEEKLKCTTRRNIAYCRVSTPSQKEDLERQIAFFRHKYPQHEVMHDIGSGINSKRKAFNAILDSAIRGEIQELVVTHKDRLCRFDFDLIKRIIEQYSNGKIVVLHHRATSPETELVEDLLSIVTVFSARLHGLRSHSIKNQIKEAALKDPKTEDISKQS